MRGPVVRGLQGAFAENWLEATGEVIAGPVTDKEVVRHAGRAMAWAVAEAGSAGRA